MRVGLVCPYSFDEPGGVQAHILDLSHYLLSRGHEVKVIGPATVADLPEFVVRGGASVAVPYNGAVARLAIGPAVSRQLREFIGQGHFDVLHIHEPNAPSFSMEALRVASGAIVATYHASASESRLLRLAVPGLRPMLEKIRGGIAVSEMARRWQVEQLGGDPVLIPNGVNTELFKRHRQPKQGRKVVFLGRTDEPRKGLDILLRARELMREDMELTVVGSGAAAPVPGVTYAGRVSDEEKARILGEADMYVAPNTGGESFGIVLVEAMAAGCAVVSSDLEAFRDVLAYDTDQQAGEVFANGDTVALANILDTLLTSSLRLRELQEAGEQRCEIFDWSRVGEQIVRVYETVADGQAVSVR